MNIVVIGGGTVGKFGNDFVRKAKSEGHVVRVLSHRTGIDTDMTTNFSNLEESIAKFKEITSDLNNIDILIYNSNYKGHPDNISLFTSKGILKEKLYLYGLYTHAVIPHALCIEALKKMSSDSKIVFMTTDVIYDRERTENLYNLGYYGGKAYQHQLMLPLAEYNDRGAIISSVSPFFDYNDMSNYIVAFEQVYNHIFNHGNEQNGKVFDCWEPYER